MCVRKCLNLNGGAFGARVSRIDKEVTLAERQTIADSKREFRQAFPHVIAPLYRRLADELLVELHLLSHQTQFQTTELFAVGLETVFETFSQGFRPEHQQPELFAALCSCNGFDPIQLKQTSQDCIASAAKQDPAQSEQWIAAFRLDDNAHYSRLMGVGLYRIMQSARGSAESPDDQALRDQSVALAETLNFPKERLEKDLGQFAANSERMSQAVELMKETIASERRKKEQRLAEKAQRNASSPSTQSQ